MQGPMTELAPGQWTETTVAQHACDIYEPRQPNPHGEVLLYLHEAHVERLRESEAFRQQFERFGLRVVSPITGRSWWMDRISPDFDPRLTAEQHLLRNVLPWIAEQWSSVPPRIGLLGIGMGGQGALRLAYKYPDTFPVVAAISPAIDFQQLWEDGDEVLQVMYPDPEAARQETALLYVHPLNWPRNQFFCCDPSDYHWWESVDRLRMKLASLGVPFEADLESSGGGHSFTYYDRQAERAVAFVAERLQRERRRLPIEKAP